MEGFSERMKEAGVGVAGPTTFFGLTLKLLGWIPI